MNEENSTMDVEFCIKNGVNVVTYSYYRTVQIFHIILSICSIVLILWVVKKYRNKFIFHYNIKVLFVSLFLGSLLHATLMTIFQCYQLILSYTYREPCDVILSRYFYISIHLPFGYSIIWIEVTQLAMLIERTIAIFYVNKYEACTKTFGNSLFLLSILIPVLGCFYAYAGEKFRNPQISCINIPVTRSLQVNTLSIFLIGCHLLALIALATTLCCSRRKSSAAQTLTSRFQLSENITSSRLLITLSATQLIIFFSYAISTVYLRFTFKPGGSLSLHNSNVLVAYLIPVYTFALPLITTIFLWRAKQSRRSEIQSMVRVKSSGAEGWATYSTQLEKQWNGQ